VRFLGFVSGVEKVSLYQAADVLVLPTSQENWGFVLVESLACGTPVVTTKGVDIWPELQSSGGALIVPAEARAMAEAVGGLLSDPARRRAMGEIGRRWVFETLGADRVARGYEAMYGGVVRDEEKY
jgi:glycosyltransferase involved in cell wall biosynthesis